MELRLTRARKIYSDGRHNAFTSIASAFGQTFVVFRAATNHGSPDGTIKVIASADHERWTTVADLAIPGSDLRDPTILVFNGTLLVVCEEEYDGRFGTLVFPSTDGTTFGDPLPVNGLPADRWLWHAQPHGGRIYATGYSNRDGEDYASLYASDDAGHWETLLDFPFPCNEVYLDFDRDGVLWALAREDNHGRIPTLYTIDAPYTSVRSGKRLPIKLVGPMVKRLDGGCVLIGRNWDDPGIRNLRTDLYWLADGHDVQLVRTLPSGGDTSYAAWQDQGPGRAVISYYSAHEHMMSYPHPEHLKPGQEEERAECVTAADIFLADLSYV